MMTPFCLCPLCPLRCNDNAIQLSGQMHLLTLSVLLGFTVCTLEQQHGSQHGFSAWHSMSDEDLMGLKGCLVS